MTESNEFIIQALIDDGELARESYERAREHARSEGIGVGEALVHLGLIEHRRLVLAKAKVCEYPFVDLEHVEVNIRNAELLPRRMAEQLRAFPLFVIDGVATVALDDPMDLSAIDQIRQQLRCDVDPVVCDPAELQRLMMRAYSLSRASDDSAESERAAVEAGRVSTAEEPNVVAVNQLLLAALEAGASDLHLNPDEREVHVRVRVDGVLRSREMIPLAAHQGIVQRLKVMGKLDLTQSRRPQDGKFRFTTGGDVVDVRLSLIPTVHGENVVCRLLRPTTSITKIEELGMSQEVSTAYSMMIRRPHGLILVTGPTGSGKTTTLYTGLAAINSPDRNIMTIEDPVEIRMPLLRQVQVNAEIGLTFAAALRSMLRQDPDVILVGEIRDEETARIAVQAALTGHLVLSTLHTNDAVGALARLRDFAIPTYAINGSLQGVLAQRLVRCVCQDCAEIDHPSAERLRRVGASVATGNFRRGVGCTRCVNTGYRGRLGVHEMLTVTGEIRKLIEEQATQVDLQRVALEQGMRTLLQDGLDKASMGLTTIDEVEKLLATVEVPRAKGLAA